MADPVPFQYQPMFPHDPAHPNEVPWRSLGSEGVRIEEWGGRAVLQVDGAALTRLASEAFLDIAHLYRPGHLAQLRAILEDPEASANDRFVARNMLQNAVVASAMVLPSCQDTGTAIVHGYKGEQVWVDGDDAEALSRGIYDRYLASNLRYSQLAPLTTFEEVNTRTNLPAQVDLAAVKGSSYELLFIAKGGGSANKTFLFQETKALLDRVRLLAWLREKVKLLGTAACPPYHLAVVIGGTSAEANLKAVKLASCRALDDLPVRGNGLGHALRDPELEAEILQMTRELGIGAQFGGRYFCHDVRVVRLPRHGASLPVGIGVSCSADRQIRARIDATGVWLEALERDPARFLPPPDPADLSAEVVAIDLNQPMRAIRATLGRYPIRTRLSLTGSLVVARDLAHARLRERLDRGEALPDYLLRHPVYYAGPAKKPEGLPSGSFGPTTAARMDPYVDLFQQHGGSLVMLAKGNRTKALRDACQRNGGFYLGSIGGSAAILAQDHIRHVEVIDMPELGMEAVWRIDVVDFPAFIVVDDKGNDFFADTAAAVHDGK